MSVASLIVAKPEPLLLFGSYKPSSSKPELPHGDKTPVELMLGSHVGKLVDQKV